MSFSRGAALTTSTTLGYADNADLGPSAGNGFYRRWPEDLAAIQELGVTDLRLTLDWARLQPKPGTLDPDWVERFEQMLSASAAIGMRTWATLHDGSIPRWFDNEGGFDDPEAFAKWWPRWVEATADRFGDHVDGWVPFVQAPHGAPSGPWLDTWTILEGVHPIVASIDPESTSVAEFAGRLDRIGLALPVDWEPDTTVDDRVLESAATRWGQLIRDTADETDSAPVVITGFDPRHGDADAAATIVARLVESLDGAIADGVRVETCFVEPAIAGAEESIGVLDQDRSAMPICQVFFTN
jgi:beta-glucosidase